MFDWELRNIYHHHPESKKRKSLEKNSGFIHPYGRYGNAVKTRKTISTIAILWPVKAIFEKRAATVEVDSFVSPVWGNLVTTYGSGSLYSSLSQKPQWRQPGLEINIKEVGREKNHFQKVNILAGLPWDRAGANKLFLCLFSPGRNYIRPLCLAMRFLGERGGCFFWAPHPRKQEFYTPPNFVHSSQGQKFPNASNRSPILIK